QLLYLPARYPKTVAFTRKFAGRSLSLLASGNQPASARRRGSLTPCNSAKSAAFEQNSCGRSSAAAPTRKRRPRAVSLEHAQRASAANSSSRKQSWRRLQFSPKWRTIAVRWASTRRLTQALVAQSLIPLLERVTWRRGRVGSVCGAGDADR